jgi:hypothetical protein
MPYGTVNADVIQTSTSGGILGAGDASLMKNRIINGAMVIDQRSAGASTTPTSSGYYSCDRWQSYLSQSSKFSIQQNAGSVTPPVGFPKYLGITSLSAYTVGSGETFSLNQQIEGYNIADLQWGTANAKTVTLSFWVYSSLTGTFGGAFRNDNGDRSYPFTYTISSASTWEQKSITVVGCPNGTWVATNGSGIQLWLGLGVGSTLSGTAGSWASADYRSATGATSVVGTNGATFYITGVQLEVGSSATGFEYVNYQTSLANCQRYYEKAYDQDTAVPSSAYAWITPTFGQSITNNALHSIVKYSVSKRARPTVTVYPFTTPTNTGRVSNATSSADFGASSGSLYIGRVNQFALYNASGGTLSVTSGDYGLLFGWSADAEL